MAEVKQAREAQHLNLDLVKMKKWLLGNRSRIGDWYTTLYIWIYKVEEYDNSDAQIRRKTLISATEHNNMEIILVSRCMCQKASVGSCIACLRGLWEVMMQESSQTRSYLLLLDQWMYQWPSQLKTHTHVSVWLWIMIKTSDCMMKLEKMQSRLENVQLKRMKRAFLLEE